MIFLRNRSISRVKYTKHGRSNLLVFKCQRDLELRISDISKEEIKELVYEWN